MGDQNKKILIIGANSFVGHHLISKLKQNNYVVGVYHKNQLNLNDDIENLPVEDLDNIKMDFDIIYLVSAYIPPQEPDTTTRKKLFEVNVELVNRICLQFSKSRIVYCSSVSVFKGKDGIINEFDAEAGLNEYGISKLWGERIVSRLNDYAIVRFSSIYGSGMKTGTIIPNYIQQSLSQRKITVFGSGKRQQNYLHVTDAVNFLNAAGNNSFSGKFLAVSEKNFSNKELAGIIASNLKSDIVFEGLDDSPSFLYDNSFTRQALGYQSKISLDEGINSLIQWIKEKY